MENRIQEQTAIGFDKIPITEIFRLKMMSKPTFYERVKDGTLSLYKMGNRSYIDVKEFNQSFKKVEIK